MKRSQINTILKEADDFFASHSFHLPPWTSWDKTTWLEMKDSAANIFETMLGWDITDFGSGDFYNRGLVLITLRNGIPGKEDKPYAEKIMMVRERQETPLHFHWNKTEDIINRGGGRLSFEFFASSRDGSLLDSPITLLQDGIRRTVEAGETITIDPGMSLTLPKGVYHRFYAEAGGGPVMTGEVSMVNDDEKDNRFYDASGRFPEIEEDESPYRYLVSDYKALLEGRL